MDEQIQRTLPTFCMTAKNRKRNVIIVGFSVFIPCCIVMIFCFIIQKRQQNYQIPEFCSQPVFIEEHIEPESYSILDIAESYSVGICGNLIKQDNAIGLWLTNPSFNQIWINAKLYNKKEVLIAETGIIKPGERCVEAELKNEVVSEEVTIEVIGYEPENYYSAGKVVLHSKIQQAGESVT